METDSTYMERAFEYLKKGYNFQMVGKVDEAIKNYQISLDIYPTAEAHTYLGWAYSFIGKLDEAIAECKKAINIDPDFGNPYNDIGSYLLQQGGVDEAITWLELALKAKRYDSQQFAHLNLGKAFELKGMWFEALDEYKKALDIDANYEAAQKLYYRLQGLLN